MTSKKCLTEAVQTCETTSTQSAFSLGGKFFDKEDLEEKHKSRPDQLAHIFKYAKKMAHPTRKVRDGKTENGEDHWRDGKGGGVWEGGGWGGWDMRGVGGDMQ